MKKISLLVLTLIIFLAGCNSSNDVKPALNGISFLAKITYYNEKYECDTVINQNGEMSLTVISPDDLKDLKMTLSQKGITAEFLGIKYTPKIDNMPFGSVAKTVYTILSQITDEGLAAGGENSNCTIRGNCLDREYEFVFSPSGLPISLTIVNDGFVIEFCNVTVI